MMGLSRLVMTMPLELAAMARSLRRSASRPAYAR